jgi:hypothetical protein
MRDRVSMSSTEAEDTGMLSCPSPLGVSFPHLPPEDEGLKEVAPETLDPRIEGLKALYPHP